MTAPTPFLSRAWLLLTACACGFVIWVNVQRIRHLDYISNVAGAPVATDAKSPTGYAGGVRQFIAAGEGADSQQWIAQTQQMFARGEARIRRVDYDNVPNGRDVTSASVYRWWLAALAEIDHDLSGRPLGVSVERAALFSDPLLQLILLVGTVGFVAWRFGKWPAALVSVGLATMFPFASVFVPNLPQDVGLQLAAAIWTVLPLLIVDSAPSQTQQTRRTFFVAGLVGGIGLWLSVGTELPILLGIVIGALVAAFLGRSGREATLLPWRVWGLGGAAACFVAYAIEFLPSAPLGLRLDVIHPLHGLAWVGVGDLLARADRRLRLGKQPRSRRELAIMVLSTVAVGIVLVLAFRSRVALFAADPSGMRLTAFIETAFAQNLSSLLSRDGFSALVLGTLIPLVLIAPAAWFVARTKGTRMRTALVIALGPVVVTAVLGCFHLRWWAVTDAMLLTLLVVGASAVEQTVRGRVLGRWLWAGGVTLVAVSGIVLLSPARSSIESVDEAELESLIERDLAHWLAHRVGPDHAAILASPNLSASLAFGGGLRALGSPYVENRDGLNLSIRIAGATSQDEALTLVQRRQITHIVLASWDRSFEQIAELSGDKEQKSLVALLHRWLPPRWLRPIPYRMPQVPGFEGQSVVVFEVVELQENSVALSHLAEYFIQMDQSELAASAGAALARLFPDDLSATLARIQVAAAAGDRQTEADTFKLLQAQLATGAAPSLPWDRRLTLAIVLAEHRQLDQARTQLEECLSEIDEPRLRSLTTVTLYRCRVLMKALGLSIQDKPLDELSRSLLPAEMRGAL